MIENLFLYSQLKHNFEIYPKEKLIKIGFCLEYWKTPNDYLIF